MVVLTEVVVDPIVIAVSVVVVALDVVLLVAGGVVVVVVVVAVLVPKVRTTLAVLPFGLLACNWRYTTGGNGRGIQRFQPGSIKASVSYLPMIAGGVVVGLAKSPPAATYQVVSYPLVLIKTPPWKQPLFAS
jgi:hypothetical protein